MWSILWAFRTPIVIGLSILAMLGVWSWHGHVKYEEGYKVGHLEYTKLKQEFQAAQDDWKSQEKKWQDQVAAQKAALEQAQKEKQEIVKQNLNEFFKQKKTNDTKRTTRENEIKVSIKPTDVIIVPSIFYWVYNDATKGTGSSQGTSSDVQIPQDRSSLAGETKTFDATAFTQVVIGNVEEYNSLALRCGKLIDVVNQLEATYNGANPEGSKGPPS
jgi:hypothetical protein